MACDKYDSNTIFLSMNIIDFPKTFVGLKCTKYIHIDSNLYTLGYLKTTYEGQLIKFDTAREISASHKAFEIREINSETLEITFRPTNECISKARMDEKLQKRFVIPLHLIKVDERCNCDKELHSETLRFYVCGQFEYANIAHYPKTICFGEIMTNKKVTRAVTIQNGSDIPIRMEYFKSAGFAAEPMSLIISPNSEKNISIIAQPPSLNFNRVVRFKIMNVHSKYENEIVGDNRNYLKYEIFTEQTVRCPVIARTCLVASLHKFYENNGKYTYVGNAIIENIRVKEIAKRYILFCGSKKKNLIDKLTSDTNKCYISRLSNKPNENVCADTKKILSIYDVRQIYFEPHMLEFGSVCLGTYGEELLTIKNNTNTNISLTLLHDENIRYTRNMLSYNSLQIKPMSGNITSVFCTRQTEGYYEGTLAVKIEDKYCLKLPYSLYVGNPTLMIKKACLYFGMLNKDAFVTNCSLNIYNYFNVDVEFNFENQCDDLPFAIVPHSGIIPKRKCRACSILLVAPTKLKKHEIHFVSVYGKIRRHIPLKLNVTNGKLLIKFSKKELSFRDIPLNLDTTRKVELENASKEIVAFSVVDSLLPGFEIEPLSGIIQPKSAIIFESKINIPCVIKFSFNLCVKINNNEIKCLPVNGNVTEPQVVIQPKILSLPRVPSYMTTYIPIVFQNLGASKALIEFMDTGYKYMFGLYISRSTIKERITNFHIEPGATETIYVKIFAPFRHEYELFLPLKINGLLGPPTGDPKSIEFQYYIDKYVRLYENNPNTEIIIVKKEISYCKISGVITTTWLKFSQENFELDCDPIQETTLDFTIVNMWKEVFPVTIVTSGLESYFCLELLTESIESTVDKKEIKFNLQPNMEAAFRLRLRPNSDEKVVRVAPLFLDKSKSIAYFNLTFVGTHRTCSLIANTYRIIFPPALLGSKLSRTIDLTIDGQVSTNEIYVHCKDGDRITVNFLKENFEYELRKTTFTFNIDVCAKKKCSCNSIITFHHCEDTKLEVEVYYCFTLCSLTLHANTHIEPYDNPYPYFPTEEHGQFFDYMTTTLTFLENWMFEEGFKEDLYPVFPHTFYMTAPFLKDQIMGNKRKGMNISYMNFIQRVAGSLLKRPKGKGFTGTGDSYETVKEICDVYEDLINLLKSRKADMYVVCAKHLLSYDQYLSYSKNVPPTTRAEQTETIELLNNENLFNRLSKQSWLDFVIQTYKVFVIDTCFFECICENSRDRNIVEVVIEWHNENIKSQFETLFKKEGKNDVKQIENLTHDLSDGIAFVSSILKYCPFLHEHFINFCTIDDVNMEGCIVNNACLITEAMAKLKINFPLSTKNLLYPNFVQMLFLSIHLYIVLPMYIVKDTITFNPPLLQSSTRNVCLSLVEQVSVDFDFVIFNNDKNCFSVEKESSGAENEKSCFIVEYKATFVEEVKTILLFYGSSKTKLFDTYAVFILVGYISAVPAATKYKLSSPMYISENVKITVVSPFDTTADFRLSITDQEPEIPVTFENIERPKFYLKRLTLKDTVLHLEGKSTDKTETSLYLKMLCFSTQTCTSWIWFRSDVGEFPIKVITQPKWNLPIQTITGRFNKWPVQPCDCGEECECYRTTVLKISHRNDLILTALRLALSEFASDAMLRVYDELIESPRGKVIIEMLLKENGVNMTELKHIFIAEAKYHLKSKTLLPRLETVTLFQHSTDEIDLPVTLLDLDEKERKGEQSYTITLVSEDGLDVRAYAVEFNTSKTDTSTITTSTP